MVEKLFVVSRYKEDYNWISEYTNDYLIYNKGEPIEDDNHIINVKNIGGNQRDICKFITDNYDNLPDVTIFCQSFPYDHCKKDVFDNLIQNAEFTSLEYYGSTPANAWEARDQNGGFAEINNAWYIQAHNSTHSQGCRYSSFDEFMNRYFENYNHLNFIRFAPGSQYLVPKQNILQYPQHFWEDIMNELNSRTPTEGHIVERSLWYIFTGSYNLREELYE